MKINFVEKCIFLFLLFDSCKNNPVISTGSIILVLIVGDRFREKARLLSRICGLFDHGNIILGFFA